MAASKQSSKHSNTHTHVHNAVSLVWGSLRLTPISDYSASSVIWTLTIRHFDYLNAKFHKSHPHLQKPCGSWRLWNQRGVPKIRIDCWREAGYSQAHGYRSRRFKITYNNVRMQQQNLYYGCLGTSTFFGIFDETGPYPDLDLYAYSFRAALQHGNCSRLKLSLLSLQIWSSLGCLELSCLAQWLRLVAKVA